MPITRLTIADTVLLVIDVQERLMPTIHRAERLQTNCAVLAQAAGVLGVPVVVTEQYVQGLGHTTARVKSALPPDARIIEKTQFSAVTPEVRAALRAIGRPTVLVCGVEAHVCVLQTVLDLCNGGWNVFYATDAISAGQPDQAAPAFRRLERAGAYPTGALSAIYELLGDSTHPRFRDCLKLAKHIDMDLP